MFVVYAAVGVEADPRTGGKLFFAHEEMCNAARKKYNNGVHYSPYINTSETTPQASLLRIVEFSNADPGSKTSLGRSRLALAGTRSFQSVPGGGNSNRMSFDDSLG